MGIEVFLIEGNSRAMDHIAALLYSKNHYFESTGDNPSRRGQVYHTNKNKLGDAHTGRIPIVCLIHPTEPFYPDTMVW